MSAPMSSSALGPLTAPSAQKGRAAGGSSRRASARSSRGPLTARRPIRVRRPAVRRGACGPEPAMRSRRWRSGSVGPPDPGRGCPELVKPILLTDIGVCMLQHPSGRASRVEIHGRGASGPLPLRTRWVPLGEVLGLLSWLPVLQSGGVGYPGAWESNETNGEDLGSRCPR